MVGLKTHMLSLETGQRCLVAGREYRIVAGPAPAKKTKEEVPHQAQSSTETITLRDLWWRNGGGSFVERIES